MKKYLIVLVGSLALVYGCSDQVEDADTKNSNVPVQQSTQADSETKLEVIKQYSEKIGDLEAYYINEEINAAQNEKDIDLTITSVEYGKVLLNETSSNAYAHLKDVDDKFTYVKLGMDISGDEAQLANYTFYAYQGEIIVNDEAFFSDTSYSDLVSIAPNNNGVTSGYVYFLVKADFPIEELTFNAPAPFDNKTMDSVSVPYEIDIELKHEK